MKWYDVEYSGGKSSTSMTGQSALNLDEVLNTPDPPKFIKLENISYRSKLSERYELYEKWDSKWENEIWINTSSIISIRTIKDDLTSNPSVGEWNAFSDKTGFSIMISKRLVDTMGNDQYREFQNDIDKLIREKAPQYNFMGGAKINVQELLDENEFIITQFGNTMIRKKVAGKVAEEIMEYLKNHFSKFAQNDSEEE